MNSPVQTLAYAFEADLLPAPAPGTRGLVLNARPGMRLPGGGAVSWTLVQGFRPLFLGLASSDGNAEPVSVGHDYDLSCVVADRHRRENELWIADALRRTKPGGIVMVAGGKTDGIASLRKRVGALLPIAGSAAKHHGLVFWVQRPADEAAATALTPRLDLVEGRYVSGPGMFSEAAVDPASRLLADCLPQDLKGRAADFCAGWGYLATRIAALPGIGSIDLYEAGHAALEAARRNLAAVATAGMPVGFHWHDLAGEPVSQRYDVIVMNPPFHQGRAAEPELGVRMIGAARAALKKGGRLFLVANRPLPYERELATGFAAQGELARDARYKVLWATK